MAPTLLHPRQYDYGNNDGSYSYTFPGWAIAIIVIAVVVKISLIVTLCICVRKRRARREEEHRRQIEMLTNRVENNNNGGMSSYPQNIPAPNTAGTYSSSEVMRNGEKAGARAHVSAK